MADRSFKPDNNLSRSLGDEDNQWDGVYSPFISDGEKAVNVGNIAEKNALGPLATTPDAPADGKTYGRKDGGWAETTGGSAEFPEGGEAGDVLVSDGDGGAEWEDREEFVASLPKASTDTLGLCRVDGETIEADADGVLSVVNAASADPFFSVSPSGGLLLNAFAEATESEFFVLSGNGIYLKGAV